MKCEDLTGQKFGRLTVVERSTGNKHGSALWLCRCDCFVERIYSAKILKCGDARSCGNCYEHMHMEGLTFGKLTVIKRVEGKGRRWLCRCVCGTEKVVPGRSLRSGNTVTCGCSYFGEGSRHWKGVGKIPGSFFNNIENGAKARNIEYNLSREHLWDLFLEQKQKCALSGEPIYFADRRRKRNTASLDRIDSGIGYVIGNIQWVHKDVNRMKNVFSQEHFVDLCQKVALCVKTKQMPPEEMLKSFD